MNLKLKFFIFESVLLDLSLTTLFVMLTCAGCVTVSSWRRALHFAALLCVLLQPPVLKVWCES